MTSAEDLRHTLRISFQPAVLNDTQMYSRVLLNNIEWMRTERITERKLRNAFEVVALPDYVCEALLKGVAL